MNLDERIYGLLEEKKIPMSISDISKEFSDVEKQDIIQKLQDMKRQGILFRRLKEGKAYYSINPSDGEGRNGSQDGINIINNIFALFGNKQALNDSGVFNNVNNTLGLPSESKLLEDVDVLNKYKIGFSNFNTKELEYKKNIFFENDLYKMAIPDSFEYIPNAEGRDFVAYLPKGGIFDDLPYNEGGARIIIYSSTIIPFSDKSGRIEETKRMLYDVIFWTGGYLLFEKHGGKPDYKVVKLNCGRTGFIYMKFDAAHNYYFTCCLKDGFKQMRIVINEVNGTREEIDNIAISLMNKFETKGRISDFNDLNDSKYLVKAIDNKLISDWVRDFKGIHRSLNEYFQLHASLQSSMISVLKSKGTFNIIKFKKDVRDGLKEYISIIERNVKNAVEFIMNARKNNIDNEIMKPAYYCLYQLLKITEFTITMDEDGSNIVEKSDYLNDIVNSIYSDEIMKLIENYHDNDYSKEVNNTDNSQVVDDEIQEICDDFFTQARKILNRYKREWVNTRDDYTDGLKSRTIESEYELKWEIKNIKNVAQSYGEKYEDFITEIDKEGKKILKQGANYTFIKGVVRLIEDTFYAIEELHLSFNTHGTAFLDLGNFDYEISSDLRKIKEWWRNEYDNNPEVIKKREEVGKLKELKKKQQEEQFRELIGDLRNDLENENKKWEKEIEDIKNEYEDHKNKLEKEAENTLKKQLEKVIAEKDEIVEDLNAEMKKLEKENRNNKKELSNMGFMKFIKKDKLKVKIDINDQNIEKYKESIKNAEDDCQKECKKIEKKSVASLSNSIEQLNKMFKYPHKPEEVYKKMVELFKNQDKILIDYGDSISPIEVENMDLKETIYNALVNLARPATITELQEYSSKLDKQTNKKIWMLLNDLEKMGCVNKTAESVKTYYEVNYDNTFVKNEPKVNDLIDKNLKNTYSVDRKKLYSVLKNLSPFTISEKDNYNRTKEMSILRIYQIYFSLEEDNIAKMGLKDGKILFRIKKVY